MLSVVYVDSDYFRRTPAFGNVYITPTNCTSMQGLITKRLGQRLQKPCRRKNTFGVRNLIIQHCVRKILLSLSTVPVILIMPLIHWGRDRKAAIFQTTFFQYILLNENVWISIKIWLMFVPNDTISNIPALVQIMAWRRPVDKELSEPMMIRLSTHKCVTSPQRAYKVAVLYLKFLT